jgi:hypothetical protein
MLIVAPDPDTDVQFTTYFQSVTLDVLAPPPEGTDVALMISKIEPVTRLGKISKSESDTLTSQMGGILFSSQTFDLGFPRLGLIHPKTAEFFVPPGLGGLTGGSLSGGGDSSPPPGTGMFAGLKPLGGIYFNGTASGGPHDLIVSFPLPETTQGGPYLYSVIDRGTLEVLASGPAAGEQHIGAATGGANNFMLLLYSAPAVENKLALTTSPNPYEYANLGGLISEIFAPGLLDCELGSTTCTPMKKKLNTRGCVASGTGYDEPCVTGEGLPPCTFYNWRIVEEDTATVSDGNTSGWNVDGEVGAEAGTNAGFASAKVTAKVSGGYESKDAARKELSWSGIDNEYWTISEGKLLQQTWI